ncbi:MAG: hypothetical protein PHV59_08155 [Victivallales bacterium]|nr:hypothetical protein [Victivallales bacterium]
MAKSKYAKYKREIIEMYSNGKSPAEIVNFLNEKDKEIKAEQNSLRVYIKRNCGKKNETGQISNAETLEKFIMNEVEMQLAVKEFYRIREKLNEAYGVFSVINHEFGEAAGRLRERAGRCNTHFFIAGAMVFVTVFALFSGYHIGRCFSRIAFCYILALSCGPAGIGVGLTIGFIIADTVNRKRLKKLENESE